MAHHNIDKSCEGVKAVLTIDGYKIRMQIIKMKCFRWIDKVASL